MKLLADSGSTNTVWYLIDAEKVSKFKTQGYNPYYFNSQEVRESIELELEGKFDFMQIKELSFYGSGCANDITGDIILKALSALFPAASISLGDDLIAAARATAGHNKGICCILGTGSNSCFYDGEVIALKIPSLGYILGDEGAGSSIGKALISSYFYKEMPSDLAHLLEAFYPMDKHEIITDLFKHKNPNRFLASFAMFCSEYKDHPFVRQLISECFNVFLTRHVLKYSNASTLPVHFVGSIAFGFRNILTDTLKRHNLSPGEIIKSPFPDLLNF
jgi:glucosamine kinase